jgi:Ca2+-binding RTX toxin-like protein
MNMSGATKWGNEFLLNTTTTGEQHTVGVTALADGRFVAVWTDESHLGGDADWSAVRAQLFNADGSKAGAELLVNTSTAGLQEWPSATALADGRFVVSWADNTLPLGGDASAREVKAQIFNGDGTKSGADFLVNTTTVDAQDAPSLTTLADGRFVAAWRDFDGLWESNIRVQAFDSNGVKSGAEISVNTTTAGVQWEPAVAGLANGRYVVSWTDESESGLDESSYAVRAQVFNANGTKFGGEILVNTATVGSQYSPTLTAIDDNRFVVMWRDGSHSPDDPVQGAVRGQVFNNNGTKSGSEFLVNTATAGDQQSPSVAALGDGRFVAAWSDASHTGSDVSFTAITAQVFNADGTKSGAAFQVNTATFNHQYSPTIAVLADGRFVVSWTDLSNSPDDVSGGAVRGQIFDPRESAVDLAGTALSDDYAGTAFNDTLAGSGGSDRLAGANGHDSITGGGASDTLVGGSGNDSLDGGTGNDSMVGGSGDDAIIVDSVADAVSEGAGGGFDTVFASISYTLGANVEDLVLTGAAPLNGTGNGLDNEIQGNILGNVLTGAGGADSLLGGQGDDTLVGGAGKDLLTGGGGLDRINITSLSDSGVAFAQRDVINGFAHGDKIDLSAIDASAGAGGNQAFSFVANFTGVAGQLQWDLTDVNAFLIYGDVNGDGGADFSLRIYAAPGFGQVQSWDFIL